MSQPTIREIFKLLRAGAYDLPPPEGTYGVVTDSGREIRPPKRFAQEPVQFVRGSGAIKREGYDYTDMTYNGPEMPKY